MADGKTVGRLMGSRAVLAAGVLAALLACKKKEESTPTPAPPPANPVPAAPAPAAPPAGQPPTTTTAGAYKAGDKVDVEWGGTWWQGEILETKGVQYKVHYIGWASSWDEWVGTSRLRAWTGKARRK